MAGEIEFLDSEPAPGEDEVLSQPGRHRRLRSVSSRRRLGAAVAALAVLAGGALVVRAAGGGASHDTAASRSPAVAPTVSTSGYASVPTVAVVPTFGPDVSLTLVPSAGQVFYPQVCTSTYVVPPKSAGTGQGGFNVRFPVTSNANGSVTCIVDSAAACPQADDGLSACTTVGGLPEAVLQAVRQRYPTMRLVSSYTEVARETRLIWFRSVDLADGNHTTIHVVLEQPGNTPGRTGSQTVNGHELARAIAVGRHQITVVEVTSPLGSHTDLANLRDLAADGRLAAHT